MNIRVDGVTRRRVLGLLAGVGAAAALPGCEGRGPEIEGNVGKLTFTNELHIPQLIAPKADSTGVKRFTLQLQQGTTEFLPGRPTATWGINGPYLGPVLRATRGDQVAIDVTNRLPAATTLHWHGMRLPASMDGGPRQVVQPGSTWSPQWTIIQPAATGWFHPHPHGATAQHVYRGLAGLFIIDEPAASALPLPTTYGVDDIPLVIQDKNLNPDGSLSEKPVPLWGYLGDTILVNGVTNPFVHVTTTRVRFRILNASNARMYHLGFADRRTFQLIGTDAGLTNAPVTLNQVRLSPGERAEIVAEFVGGEQVILKSFRGNQEIDGTELDVLQVVAAAQLRHSPVVPSQLARPEALSLPAGARVRHFELDGDSKLAKKSMDMDRIDEIVPAGAREIWEIQNNVFAHNFHIHEVAFRVLSVGGRPPAPYETGPKDTVFIPRRTTVRLAVQFGRYTDPSTPYMYHCHILRHEDKGMMGQFVIVEPGAEATTPRQLHLNHHHH